MNEVDYKQLIAELKKFLTLQWDYSRLTATEKTTILLSSVAFVAVIVLLGGYALHHLLTALTIALAGALGSTTWAHVIVAGVLVVVILFIAAFRKPLIINPIARFVSRLFLNPDDDR